MPDGKSFPALEELKQDADGVDVLVEIAPRWLEPAIEWLFDVEYAARKRDLLDERDEIRERYTTGRQRIEKTYGSVVSRTVRRRTDGTQPHLDIDQLEGELEDARVAIAELYDDLDEDYLSRPERRYLSALESAVFNRMTEVEFPVLRPP